MVSTAAKFLLLSRHGTSGLDITSFTQSLGAELLTFGDFSSNAGWTTETGWAIAGGVLTGTPVQAGVTYQGISLTKGFYEVGFTAVRTAGSISARLSTTEAVRGKIIATSVTTQELLLFPGGAQLFLLYGDSVLGYGGTIDNATVKPITRNAVHTMPNADGTYTFSFTLPASPKAGQEARMFYRYDSDDDCWAASIIRNAANSAWDFILSSVSGGTKTDRITVTDVGTPDAVRVVTSGSTHTPYTGVSGTFTQRSSATVSHLDTETGITTMYSSAITPVRLTSF